MIRLMLGFVPHPNLQTLSKSPPSEGGDFNALPLRKGEGREGVYQGLHGKTVATENASLW